MCGCARLRTDVRQRTSVILISQLYMCIYVRVTAVSDRSSPQSSSGSAAADAAAASARSGRAHGSAPASAAHERQRTNNGVPGVLIKHANLVNITNDMRQDHSQNQNYSRTNYGSSTGTPMMHNRMRASEKIHGKMRGNIDGAQMFDIEWNALTKAVKEDDPTAKFEEMKAQYEQTHRKAQDHLNYLDTRDGQKSMSYDARKSQTQELTRRVDGFAAKMAQLVGEYELTVQRRQLGVFDVKCSFKEKLNKVQQHTPAAPARAMR